MPRTGQILFHKAFVFENDTKGDKLFIVLNNCDSDEECLVLKTTSQARHYPNAKTGCNSDKMIYCIRQSCNQGFDKDTFVQMNNVIPINMESLLQNKQISFVDHLDENCFSMLKKCLRNYREDIPVKYWTLIFPQPAKKK